MATTIRIQLDGDFKGVDELEKRFQNLNRTLVVTESSLAALEKALSTIQPPDLKVNPAGLDAAKQSTEELDKVIDAATESAERLDKTLDGVDAPKIEVDAVSVEDAAKAAQKLTTALDGLSPDGIRSTIAAANSLEAETNALIQGFNGTADSLSGIVTAAGNANRVVRDLLSAETQSSSLLRQTRAAIEVLQGLENQTEATQKRTAELREDEARLAKQHTDLAAAAEKASKSARTLAAAADRAQGEVDQLGEESDGTASKIDGLNRAAEKNRLAVLNRAAAQSRRELRAASGASADFIASMDRIGAAAARNAGNVAAIGSSAGVASKGLQSQVDAANASVKVNEQLKYAASELSQAWGVNSVAGNSVVNTLQRMARAGTGLSPIFSVLSTGVVAAYVVMEIWERVAKSSGDEAKELEGRIGSLGKEFHDTTGEVGGFGKALDLAFQDRNKSGLTSLLSDVGDALKDVKDAAVDLVDDFFPDGMADRIEENRDLLFGISKAERELAKQAELREQAQQRAGIVSREVARALQEDEIEHLATVEEVTDRIQQIERQLADERIRQNAELVEHLAKQEGLLTERLVELRLEEREAEREAVEESKKLQKERVEDAKKAREEISAEFAKFAAVIDEREGDALSGLIAKRDRLKALAADETEVAEAQADIVAELTRQYGIVERQVRETQQAFVDAMKDGTSSLELQQEYVERQNKAVSQFMAISRQLAAEEKASNDAALTAERAIIDKRREAHEDRLKQLAVIRQTERDLFDLLSGQNISAEERIAAETQLDELLLRRDAILKRTSDQSAAALENEKAIREEITETAAKYLKKLGDQKRRLTDLIASGKDQTEEARELREEYESSVAVLKELKAQQDKLNAAKANSVAQAEVSAFDARVSAIEQFLAQQQQGGEIKRQIGSQVTDRDVNQQLQQQRQQELTERLPEVLQDVVRKLAEKGVAARIEGGKVVAADPSDRATVRRTERAAVDAARRETFRRPVSESEQITARENAISKRLDEIAKQGADKETVSVLQEQLRTEADQLRTQAETRDAIKDLTNAINSPQKPQEAAQQPQQQMTPAEFQQRQRAAEAGQQSLENPMRPIAAGAQQLTTATGANLNAQAKLADAVGAGFEAVSRAQSEQASQIVQLSAYLGALAEHVGAQSNSLRSAVSQNMSRGGAALRMT